MNYKTDRQRIEIMFAQRLIYQIIIRCLGEDITKSLKEEADLMIEEPISDLDFKKRNSLKRRCMSLEQKHILKPFIGKVSGEKIVLVAYHFLEWVMENYLDVQEGTRLYTLTNYVLGKIDTSLDGFSSLDRSAKKQAIQLVKKLQKDGYYITN